MGETIAVLQIPDTILHIPQMLLLLRRWATLRLTTPVLLLNPSIPLRMCRHPPFCHRDHRISDTHLTHLTHLPMDLRRRCFHNQPRRLWNHTLTGPTTRQDTMVQVLFNNLLLIIRRRRHQRSLLSSLRLSLLPIPRRR